MPRSKEVPKMSTGLEAAWHFWRAVEGGDIVAAQKHAALAASIKSLDPETKKLIAAALKTTERAKPDTEVISSSTRSRPPQPKSPKERIQSPAFFSASESSTEEQIRTLNEILSLFSDGRFEKALEAFTALPNLIDQSKVLCSLISSKTGASHNTALLTGEMAQRDSIASCVPEKDKPHVIAAFLKAYFGALPRT
jgi:hypothetical protein